MLPIRFIAEALGAEVEWNGLEQKVTIVKDDIEIIIFDAFKGYRQVLMNKELNNKYKKVS